MLSNALKGFDPSDHGKFCPKKMSVEFPCELIRYPDDVTAQDITGTFDALLTFLIKDCSKDFGWQWKETMEQLRNAVGGYIPQIIIPVVSGRHFLTCFCTFLDTF